MQQALESFARHNFVVWQIIFINRRDDLSFVFKFRKISKVCKNISEYWLVSIDDCNYLDNVDVKQFRNLKYLSCDINITNDDLLPLIHLESLFLHVNYKVTDNGIKHLKLKELYVEDVSNITDIGVQYMTETLEYLHAGWSSCKITDQGLKNLKLRHLNVIGNDNITNDAIKNMTTLKYLDIHYNDNITDDGLKQLYLENLICNKNITNDAIKNMTTLKDLDIYCNDNITDDGLKHLYLEELCCNKNITDAGIKHMSKTLKILDVMIAHAVTDAGLKEMQLIKLYAPTNKNITEAGIAHMPHCQFF